MGILGRTIGRVVPQIAVFFLISCVIFLAFAQCFFLAYYASVPGYQSFWQSIMSVLRFTVLDFDYQALSNVSLHLSALPSLLACLLVLVRRSWRHCIVLGMLRQQDLDAVCYCHKSIPTTIEWHHLV
jgi:hypothetical protein